MTVIPSPIALPGGLEFVVGKSQNCNNNNKKKTSNRSFSWWAGTIPKSNRNRPAQFCPIFWNAPRTTSLSSSVKILGPKGPDRCSAEFEVPVTVSSPRPPWRPRRPRRDLFLPAPESPEWWLEPYWLPAAEKKFLETCRMTLHRFALGQVLESSCFIFLHALGLIELPFEPGKQRSYHSYPGCFISKKRYLFWTSPTTPKNSPPTPPPWPCGPHWRCLRRSPCRSAPPGPSPPPRSPAPAAPAPRAPRQRWGTAAGRAAKIASAMAKKRRKKWS